MACLVCGGGDAAYRLVGGTNATAVCEQCVEEHLDVGGQPGRCAFCEQTGDVDLVRASSVDEGRTGTVRADDDYDAVAEDVLCETHFESLAGDDEDEAARPPDDAAGTGPDV